MTSWAHCPLSVSNFMLQSQSICEGNKQYHDLLKIVTELGKKIFASF